MARLNAALLVLVLQVGSATGVKLASRAKDFPLLTNLLFDMCGVSTTFDLSPSSPCQYSVFGLSVAWSECGDAHESDMTGFRACLGSCSTPDICARACSEHPAGMAKQQCDAECDVLSSCLREALLKSTGQVSAETQARTCFTGAGGKASTRAGASSFLAARAKRNSTRASDEFKPAADYAILFPKSCELLGEDRSSWRQKLPVPPAPVGHGSAPLEKTTPAPPPLKFADAFKATLGELDIATTPLPAAWHDARHGAFNGQAAKGPPVPPALDTGEDWMKNAQDDVPECAKTMSVMGLEFTEQGSRMGKFELVEDAPPGVHSAGRPVYRSSKGQYLYYWDTLKVWRIGDDYMTPEAGVTSTAGLATECPDLAQGWSAWIGGQWTKKHPINVVAANDVPPPPANKGI